MVVTQAGSAGEGAEPPSAASAALGLGYFVASFAACIPARLAFERAAIETSRATLPPSPFRAFPSFVRMGASQVATTYRSVWNRSGLLGFGKWWAIAMGNGVATFAVQELVQGQVTDEFLGVRDEDREDRTPRWYSSKILSMAVSAVAIMPVNVLWTLYAVEKPPVSLRRFVVDRVIKGGSAFWAPAFLSSVSFVLFFFCDVLRAKLLYYHRKLLYPDLDDPHIDEIEEEFYDGRRTGILDWRSRSSRQLQHAVTSKVVYFLSAGLTALLCTPVDLLVCRMNVYPNIYGRAGTLGAIRLTWREEGLSGFFRGFLANTLFVAGLSWTSIAEEEATGKPPL